MTPKFSVGQILDCIGGVNAGHQVEVLAVGPFGPNNRYQGYAPIPPCHDYVCTSVFLDWMFYEEKDLRKRPQPDDQLQKFRDTLKPCEHQFRDGQFQRWLNPAPAPADLEARIARIFPSLSELNKRQQVFHALYGTKPLWGYDE